MSNMTLDTCALFVQLPSGHWAGDSFSGWKVSIQSFEQGQYPDRFKHEPARKATEDEIVLVKSLICKIAAAKTSASEDAERRLLERMRNYQKLAKS